MAITAKKPEVEFQLAPQGTHVARCYMVADMGLQDTPFGAKHKLRYGWELPNELMEDGRPFVVGKEYTLSLHPDSNLAQDLTSWRGRSFTDAELEGFDVSKVIGAPCMITVIHTKSKKGKDYAVVKSVTTLPKGMICPNAINEPVVFSLEQPNEEAFQNLPEWIRNRINRGEPLKETQTQDFDDDIPF